MTHQGKYLRKHRVAAGLSLRNVADAVGISHVFLSEVERGVRPIMPRHHWPSLSAAIPGVTLESLARLAIENKPLEIELAGAPPQYKELGLALALRIQNQDLPATALTRLLAILQGNDDGGEIGQLQ